ncbi:hypothetical protein SAMN02799630_03149 [Paenibacillus sp. UNCCL117]|uniref:DUF7667 family protein n=1 Tax=unclassified Paenibacillus TaxID=185978 RepID=UPI000883F88A|nr:MULTISPECIES: hypothetical protein [unclassified Paenibacillus]SDD90091.1 hypothetical protein SAMN04488602_11535 [Paenibacillus sp. cl123]SFW44000.1 hypothetical protein SAMN02799630_03149 [Paenibacillus sp. UNCCL117]
MLPFHLRMAEIWTHHQNRELTVEEQNELSICLQANANYARKLAELHNYIDAASITGDKEWLQVLTRKLVLIEQEFRLQLAQMKKSKFEKGQM